jgi:hypothetical protein
MKRVFRSLPVAQEVSTATDFACAIDLPGRNCEAQNLIAALLEQGDKWRESSQRRTRRSILADSDFFCSTGKNVCDVRRCVACRHKIFTMEGCSFSDSLAIPLELRHGI